MTSAPGTIAIEAAPGTIATGLDPDGMLADARKQMDAAHAAKIRAELAAELAKVETRTAGSLRLLAVAEADLRLAEQALEVAERNLSKVKADAREVIAQIGGPDVVASVAARGLRRDLAEESDARFEAVDAAEDVASECQGRVMRLLSEEIDPDETQARRLREALKAPFTHPVARLTKGYGAWMAECGAWPVLSRGDHDDEHWAYAVQVLHRLMAVTGVGAETESRVETGVHQQYSDRVTLADGRVLVLTGLATPDELARRFRAPARLPSETELANGSIFDPGGRSAGLPATRPGVRP